MRAAHELFPGIASNHKPLLLCFSHLRWDFVFQRPQHILTRASKNYRVIYFEEPIAVDQPHLSLKISLPHPDLQVATPLLPRDHDAAKWQGYQRTLLDLLVDDIRARPLLTWYYTPMALAFSGHLDQALCVYDCMDELTAFKGAPEKLKEYERQLFRRADLVFTGGQSLYEAKRKHHPRVHAFPSSIDARHFGKARHHPSDPADQSAIPFPRVGFFGVIDERMDLEMVDRVAQSLPDIQFVMVGPVVKIDPATLPQRPNIHWLGGKSYDELPAYLGNWTMGWMPFAINASTRFISPTKTPEFLAAGLPVVSTPIVDVVRSYGKLGLVQIGSTAEECTAEIREALSRPRERWLERVDRHLATMSWDRTWSSMHASMVASQQEKIRQSPPVLVKASRLHV